MNLFLVKTTQVKVSNFQATGSALKIKFIGQSRTVTRMSPFSNLKMQPYKIIVTKDLSEKDFRILLALF